MKFSSYSERMTFGLELAEFMSILVRKITNKLGYIISKGGITTPVSYTHLTLPTSDLV